MSATPTSACGCGMSYSGVELFWFWGLLCLLLVKVFALVVVLVSGQAVRVLCTKVSCVLAQTASCQGRAALLWCIYYRPISQCQLSGATADCC